VVGWRGGGQLQSSGRLGAVRAGPVLSGPMEGCSGLGAYSSGLGATESWRTLYGRGGLHQLQTASWTPLILQFILYAIILYLHRLENSHGLKGVFLLALLLLAVEAFFLLIN